jgi:hypothetical protein
MNREPIFIHCCNCHQCQRMSGSAFALNLLIEASEVEIVTSMRHSGEDEEQQVGPRLFVMPGEDPKGRLVARCPRCFVAVWTQYAGTGRYVKFIRGGTLDRMSVDGRIVENALRPDMYIFTATQMPWVDFPDGLDDPRRVVKEYYDPAERRPKEAQERLLALRKLTQEWNDRGSPWEEEGEVTDCR